MVNMGSVGRSKESSLQVRSESEKNTSVASLLCGGLRHVATASEFRRYSHVDNRRARPGSVEARNDILVNHVKSGICNCLSVETSRNSSLS